MRSTGAFITALEQACDIKAEVVGKPTRSFFEVCLRSLEAQGIQESDWPNVAMVSDRVTLSVARFAAQSLALCLMQIGDDYRNDLGEGVQELKLRRYLVRTGKYREGDETRLEEGPAACFDTFADVVDAILGDENDEQLAR